jgi:hypothetical protein
METSEHGRLVELSEGECWVLLGGVKVDSITGRRLTPG